MTPPASQSLLRCCCCLNIQVSILCLGVYHMIMSGLLLIQHSLEVGNGKENHIGAQDYYKIVDIASSFLLIVMLLLISVCLICGLLKNRKFLLIPFLALQVLDFLLSSVTLCSSYIELPAYLHYAPERHAAAPSPEAYSVLQILDFIFSLLTLCSSYMEIPAYLNFKSMNHMNYFPNKQIVSPQKSIKMLICFSIIFIVVLIFKGYMINCVWRCYKYIRDTCKPGIKKAPEFNFPDKVLLPTYEEAIKLPCKALPPPYSPA